MHSNLDIVLTSLYICSDGGETQADFSEVFPDLEGEEERSGDFYNTPASPITVPYCPRPASTGRKDYESSQINLFKNILFYIQNLLTQQFIIITFWLHTAAVRSTAVRCQNVI